MGLIKAAVGAIGGTLADQWIDAIRPADMGQQTLVTYGENLREGDRRNGNRKSSNGVITNGSKIQVYDGQMMLLVDGGRVVDFTAEPGFYTVDNGANPSLFRGEFSEVIKETFERFKYGGGAPQAQEVVYINLQEIKGIKFGTKNPVSYYDTELDADLYIRAHGSYSIKITDPILFYQEVVPKNAAQVEVSQVNQQFLDEFISALQASINQMSADGMSVRRVASQSVALSKYMAQTLDEDWRVMRGFEVQSVGMEVSYDDETRELFKMRTQGAMLKDAAIREGYVQGAVARGMEAAGSNSGGSMAGFMGMGVGMQNAGMNNFSDTNRMQMQQQAAAQAAQPAAPAPSANAWTCECGNTNTNNFCASCGKQKPVATSWTCACGNENTGRFCPSCGKPQPQKVVCGKCGYEPAEGTALRFCPNCGNSLNA